MTCEHTLQIVRKISDLSQKAINSNSDLYWATLLELRRPPTCITPGIEWYKDRVKELEKIAGRPGISINKEAFKKYFSEIIGLIGDCDCHDEVIDKYDDLIRETVSKEEFNRVRKAYEELYESNKKDIKDYNELLRKNEVLVERVRSLQDRYNDLSDRFDDVNTKYEEIKDRYEDTKDERESERVNNARTNTRLEERLESASAKVLDLTRRLTNSENENDRLLIKLDEKNVIHNQRIENLNNQLTTLRLESGEKDSRLREKETELARKKEEIERLKRQGGLSQEELLTEKLRSEKGNLELLANELKIGSEQIHSLTKYHERLFVAQKNRNQANIDVHEGNISRVKQGLTNQKISVVHIQEVCRKCEVIAKLCWELEQSQQQFEAQQEVPPRQ